MFWLSVGPWSLTYLGKVNSMENFNDDSWIDGFLMASYEERFECDEPWNEDLYGDNPFEDEEGEE